MKKKLMITLTMVMLLCVKSFGQKSFKDGYIITLKKDTIYGKVKYRPDSKNYVSCLFKKGNDTKEYFPNEIYEFGYKNSLTFKSKIVPNRFAKCLVRGRINLYHSMNMFHIEKNGEIFDLKKHTNLKEYKWQVLLFHHTNDCSRLLNNSILNLHLKKEDLTNFIIKYNNCMNSKYKVFNDLKKQ